MIICHTGADPDALSSLAAMKFILYTHYQKKEVLAVGERIPVALSFIPGYSEVTNGSILETLQKNSVDLLICLDFGQLHLSSKLDAGEIKKYLQKAGIPVAIIDHHPAEHKDIEADVYINIDPTSTATNLHLIFHKELGLPIIPKVADSLMYGIIADTNRFKFAYGQHSQAPLLSISAELLAHSTVSIEHIANSMERIELATLKVISVFMKNTELHNKEFAYTLLSNDDLAAYDLDSKKLGDAALYISNLVISLVETATSGVVIYPHLLEDNVYTARFRASSADTPVDQYAKLLGGGGHPQSAAARIKANSAQEALAQVLAVIEKTSL